MARPIKKQNWTTLDAFGMLNGISTWDDNYQNLKFVRLPDETSLELRRKILNIHDRPILGTAIQDTINGLSNQLMMSGYDIYTKHSFVLTQSPIPYGDINTQDIWLEYQPPNQTGWYSITPQWWSQNVFTDYDNLELQTSGFIVWQNEYYRSESSDKRFDYSRLLEVLSDIPDKSKLRIQYYIRTYDDQYNPEQRLYTDLDNPFDPNATSFVYRSPYNISASELTNKISAYTLADIPPGLSGLYYDSDGTASDLLYKIRDYMDVNLRHRWKDITNKSTIWDVHRRYARGTIPSFYDEGFSIASGVVWDDNIRHTLTGGIDHEYPTLYMKDISVVLSGDYEYWYPVLQPGHFYVKGVPYYLMDTPKYISITPSGTSLSIPSGDFPERGMYTILFTSGYYNDMSTRVMFDDYQYPIEVHYDGDPITIQEYISSPSVFRHRPYMTSSKGLDVSLGEGEYSIDYENRILNIDSTLVGQDLTLVWDYELVSSGKMIESEFADLNPLNDENLEHEKYFFFIGTTEEDI